MKAISYLFLICLSVTIVAEEPRLAKYIPEMIDNIAAVLEVDNDAVNVKATTSERLGFIGRVEGISAYAVATIISKS